MATDESTPLLENSQAKKKTPLPKTQLGLTLFVLFSEPMSSLYIFPFINQDTMKLIRELGVTGGDDRKIGYYAGVIESLFFATQALTVLCWSRLSDHVGRKPVLLVGLAGLSVSNLCFGLSREFWALVASRCIAGALNGNVSVMKSIIGDITDTTNMARAFALIPIVFSVGASIAPLFGGGLAKPHDRWPELFSGSFWVQYPYFLPSASLPSKRRGKELQLEGGSIGSQVDTPVGEDTSPVPIRTLLKTYSVMLPIANYGLLGLVDNGFFAFVPLFYATPVEIGGLGLTPFTIGVIMMVFSVGNGFFQVSFTARAIERFGERRVFCSAVLAFFPIIATFPTMSWIVGVRKEVGLAIWVIISVQLLLWAVVDMAYVRSGYLRLRHKGFAEQALTWHNEWSQSDYDINCKGNGTSNIHINVRVLKGVQPAWREPGIYCASDPFMLVGLLVEAPSRVEQGQTVKRRVPAHERGDTTLNQGRGVETLCDDHGTPEDSSVEFHTPHDYLGQSRTRKTGRREAVQCRADSLLLPLGTTIINQDWKAGIRPCLLESASACLGTIVSDENECVVDEICEAACAPPGTKNLIQLGQTEVDPLAPGLVEIG
ncbi:major facilitator superfamily domain-containing protein [Pisolithus thermaeus]|nr:major facilitator superfamily domain-containing protein [Pisolithus thermaeus]